MGLAHFLSKRQGTILRGRQKQKNLILSLGFLSFQDGEERRFQGLLRPIGRDDDG